MLPEVAVHPGDQWICEVEHALECGRVVAVEELHEDPAQPPATLVRRATLQDLTRADESLMLGHIAVKRCVAVAGQLKLPIRIGHVHYSFDHSVLRIQFTAEERVDFREMLRLLGEELHTRVEMRQIGVRDQAGVIGGMGPCGRTMCCCTWLKQFESVNVRMAKTQRLSLNPAAIGGMCGRLKCCLKFEQDCYAECARHLPKDGARITTPDGKGVVVDQDILRQRVRVRLEGERVIEYDLGVLQFEPAPVVAADAKREPAGDESKPETAEPKV